jgi:5,10-methylene-tetrahydrofolate dehydrogenase/methenyl tetrahydrofolate cyclohydrolase
MEKELLVYYDNPNEASDMYLKWITKDCEENNIKVTILDDLVILKERLKENRFTPVLPLYPVKDYFVKNELEMLLMDYPYANIDNIGGVSFYTDATAQGIFNYIVENDPQRNTVISVIGRGKVGKALIDLLISYGYTVFEFNSQSIRETIRWVSEEYADYIIGVSSAQLFDEYDCKELRHHNTILIDSGNNFDTKDKLRCGKWTRKVIIDRINNLYLTHGE